MEKERVIDIRRYTNALKHYWWLYAITAVVMLGLAGIYSIYRMDQYEIEGDILIESENEGPSGGAAMLGGELTSLMRSFSLGSSLSKSVENEAEIIYSPGLIHEAVMKQKYNHLCTEYDGLKRSLLHKDNPVTIVAEPEYEDTVRKALKFMIKLDASGNADIVVKRGFFGRVVGTYNGKLPAKIATDFGSFVVMATDAIEAREYDLKYVIGNSWDMVDYVRKHAEVIVGKKTDVIYFVLKDANRERGIDFVNQVFEEYLTKRRLRKNKVAGDALALIDQRLAAISEELSQSEQTIEQFMNEHNITDLTSEVAFLFRENKEVDSRVVSLRSEQVMLRMALASLRDKDKYAMLPVMNNMGETATNTLVEKYNEEVVKRLTLLQSAKEDNVSLRVITENIDAMRSVVIESIERADENIEVMIKSILKKSNENSIRLNSMPSYERQYYDLKRNQMFTNQLYLFLLQKRENNMLKIASIDEAGNIIQPAYGDRKPLKKKTYLAFGAAFLLMLLLPSIYVLWKLNREDLVLGDYDLISLDNAVDGTGDDGIEYLRHNIRDDAERRRVFVVSLVDYKDAVDVAVGLQKSMARISVDSVLCLLDKNSETKAGKTGDIVAVGSIENLSKHINGNGILSLASAGLGEVSIVDHPLFDKALSDASGISIVALSDVKSIGVVPAASQVVVVTRKGVAHRTQLKEAIAAVAEGNRAVAYLIG